MPRPSSEVDDLLAALADPTRRALFESVNRDGPVTATALAAALPISRQAVTKHLERLGSVGLATSQRVGRETLWRADPAPLRAAVAWMIEVGAAWDSRLDRLARHVRDR